MLELRHRVWQKQHSTLTQITTRKSSPHLKIGLRTRQKTVRAHLAITCWIAALYGMSCSIIAATFAVRVVAVVNVPMTDNTIMAVEELRTGQAHSSIRAIARLAVRLVTRPKTVKPARLKRWPQPCPCLLPKTQSHQWKKSPSDTIISGTGPRSVKQWRPWQRTSAATHHNTRRPLEAVWIEG